MKKSNENPRLNCDDVERLLINRIFDELSQDENTLAEKHLKSCDRCRGYQKTLLNLQNSMRVGVGEKVTPDPAIRENIIQRMKALRPEKAGTRRTSWQYVRNVFEYPIPVYQVLSGLVLIALIFLVASQISFSPNQEPSEPQSLARIEASLPAQMSVIDNLKIIEQQKIGQNVKEDTTLTRFIVTTM
jgi:anti-sigma factor RsiW